MFGLSIALLVFVLDTSLKAALVAVAAAALMKLLRLGDSNLRHRIWTGVLAGMLLLPLLTPIVPALRLPLLPSSESLLAWLQSPIEAAPVTDKESRLGVAPPSDTENTPASIATFDKSPAVAPFNALLAENSVFARAEAVPPPAETEKTPELADSHAAEQTSAEPASNLSSPRRPTSRRFIAAAIFCLAAIWFIGSLVLAVRLIAGLWLAAGLRRSSTAIDATELSGRVAWPLACSSARQSKQVIVPITVGFLHPQIILPQTWRTWPADKLQAVLAHESMHIERGDCAIALLAEVNCCLYWFHPLAWWLKRQLAELAEQACDDAAIAALGDRAQYARHLLEVAAAASRYRGRLAPAGLSMAHASGVEMRILSILDFTRPLSRRLTWAKALLLLALMIPLIIAAAALSPAGGKNADNNAVASEEKETKEATLTFAGSVIDERGHPVAGATITLGHWSEGATEAPRLAVTDAEGKFQFSKTASELTSLAGSEHWHSTPLVATKDGYGLAIGGLAYFEPSGAVEAAWTERSRDINEYRFGKKSTVLKLIRDDVPIHGRVLNSEGQPVAGVKVEPVHLWRGTGDSLDAWEAAVKEPNADERRTGEQLTMFSQSGYSLTNGDISAAHLMVLPAVRTDADGRFTLKGLGRERIVELYISGPGIATMTARARTRQGDVIRLPEKAAVPEAGRVVFYSTDFTCIATPSVPVEGRVTDRRTGEPLRGMLVQGYKIATNDVHGGLEAHYIHTLTGDDGRYRLEGLPLGRNLVHVIGPGKSRFLTTEIDATLTLGAEPLVRDAASSSGVIVHGTVTDSRTGKPLAGQLEYFVFENNPNLSSAQGCSAPMFRYTADKDGRYELPVLPGPGILAFRAENNDADYPHGIGADRIDGPKTVSNAIFFMTVPWRCAPDNFHIVLRLNPAADADELKLDFSLTSGASFIGRVVGPDGQAVERYHLYGATAFGGWYEPEGAEFEIRGYFPDRGRRVIAYDSARNLIGQIDLSGDPPKDVQIKLQPAGKLVGRIVDAEGSPLEGLIVGSELSDINPTKMYFPDVAKKRGILYANHDGYQRLTDKDGRFELKGIMPGMVYSLGVSGPTKMYGRPQMTYLGTIFENAILEAGQTKDLGKLRIKDRELKEQEEAKAAADSPRETAPAADKASGDPKKPASSEPKPTDDAAGDKAKTNTAPAPAATSEFRGQVVDAGSKAVSGAKIYSIQSRHPDLEQLPPRLIATTNAAGEFKMALPTAQPSDPKEQLGWTAQERLVITAPGNGFVATSLEQLRNQPPATGLLSSLAKAITGGGSPTISLPKAGESIRGRLVDIDGQPVVGATVKIRWFDEIKTQGAWSRNAETKNDEKAAWQERVNNLLRVIEPVQYRDVLPQATTDAGGRFELRDLGANRLFQLLIQGERIEALELVARNQPGDEIVIPPERGFRDHEVTLYPRDFARAVGPSKPVTGRVLDFDTGEPITGAVVRAYAIHGSRLHSSRDRQHFATRTVPDGRYKITGLPIGKENRLVAFTMGDVPYIPVGLEADTAKSDGSGQDFRLKRGVFAEGRVYDGDTDRPFTGQISYYWFRNRKLEQEFPGLFYAMVDELYWTNGLGEFRVPVLPARGILAFRYAGRSRGNDGIDRFPRGGGADAIVGAQAMGSLNAFPTLPHYLMPTNYERVGEVNPQAGQKTVRVDLPLFASQPVKVRVVDAEGNAVTGCEIYGANERWGWQPKSAAEFSIEDLHAGERRKVFAFHRSRNLAGGAIASRDAAQPVEIKLAPSGSISGRLIDADGLPITDAELHADYDKLKADDNSGVWANHPKLFSNPTHIPVDKDGRFEVDGLIPGWTYNAYATAPRKFNGQPLTNFVIGRVFRAVRIEPGEKKDLDDIRIGDQNDE